VRPYLYFGAGVLSALPLAWMGLYVFRRRVHSLAVERGGPKLREELATRTSGALSLVNTPEYERVTNALVGIGANAAMETIGIPRVE